MLEDLKYRSFAGWLDSDRKDLIARKLKTTRIPKQLRKLTSDGYILRYSPDHHYADSRGFVREHRLVWERHNKAALLPWAYIRHINDIRHDNRIENLEVLPFVYHPTTRQKSNRKPLSVELPEILQRMGI